VAHNHNVAIEALVTISMAIGRKPAARLAADLANIGDGNHVIDLGCGPGNALREAARRGATGIGVDPSPRMLRLARLLSAGDARRRIIYADGTAERIPCSDASADVVWALSSAHHWADQGMGLAEAQRVLKPNGQLLVLERVELPGEGRGHHAVTKAWADELATNAQRLGFVDATVAVHGSGKERRVVVKATRA
jgi:ubiquinone/menaquinone biosynthesis C-methylase UbiE